MSAATANLQFAEMDAGEKKDTAQYNFKHFRAKHLLSDAWSTFTGKGIKPREIAPDFSATGPDGSTRRLGDLRGRPVLLHFGSFT